MEMRTFAVGLIAAAALGLSACSSVTSGTAQPVSGSTSGHTQGDSVASELYDLDGTKGDPLNPSNFSTPGCHAGGSAKDCLESLVGRKFKLSGQVTATYPTPGNYRDIVVTRTGASPWIELCPTSVAGCSSVNEGDNVTTVIRIDHVQMPGVPAALAALPGMVAESVTVQ